MTDFASLLQPDRGQKAHAVHLVDKESFEDWLKGQSETIRAAIHAQRFKGKGYELAILPGNDAEDWSVVLGVANADALSPWCLAKASGALPDGHYRLVDRQPGAAALGWLLAQHRFERYLSDPDPLSHPVLLTGEVAMIDEHVRIAEAVALVRDLVDTPAADLGPAELAAATESLAREMGAECIVTQGDALEQAYPMIAAVGRAATRERAPRLIELFWGNPAHPRIALVGKGVCFDSGGIDMKPAGAMLIMKKDMGGAAHMLALARLVMGAQLPVRLHLLIPAIENSVSGDAYRPGDILKSRKGIRVEVGNTDAEGRLILADALTRACEEKPELIIDFATLTGAARVALGPDLPPFFTNDEQFAAEFAAASERAGDPLWRMPLWQGYGELLKSNIADLGSTGEGGMAGAVIAALFLERFIEKGIPWVHVDTFAWRPAAKPGRPKGGDALGLRAAYVLLKTHYSPSS